MMEKWWNGMMEKWWQNDGMTIIPSFDHHFSIIPSKWWENDGKWWNDASFHHFDHHFDGMMEHSIIWPSFDHHFDGMMEHSIKMMVKMMEWSIIPSKWWQNDGRMMEWSIIPSKWWFKMMEWWKNDGMMAHFHHFTIILMEWWKNDGQNDGMTIIPSFIHHSIILPYCISLIENDGMMEWSIIPSFCHQNDGMMENDG